VECRTPTLYRGHRRVEHPANHLGGGVAALLRYIAEFHDAEVWTDALYGDDDEDSEREPIVDNDGLFKEILENLAEAAESIHA
jgi:hypothetical protein